MKEKRMDVLIIGGGASGLMAAITAARAGCRVLILEHKEEPGKKILATGNGRCNFTNTVQGSECYRGSTPAFVLQCLELFGAQNAIDFFKEIGIWTKDREGYCYPRSMQAVTIRDGLLQEVHRLHVSVKCDVGIRKIQKENGVFRVQSKEGDFYGKTCILATGGAASPQSGSDGSGYLYAKQLGHSCIEPVPALVPLHANETWLKQVKGVRAEGVVTLLVDGKEIAASGGELQLTDYGISGIPTFMVSRYAARALKENNTVMAMVDFPSRGIRGRIDTVADRPTGRKTEYAGTGAERFIKPEAGTCADRKIGGKLPKENRLVQSEKRMDYEKQPVNWLPM